MRVDRICACASITFQTTEEYGPGPESQLAARPSKPSPVPASLPPDKKLSKRQDGYQYLLFRFDCDPLYCECVSARAVNFAVIFSGRGVARLA